jgi:hypothetical protein
VARWRSHSNLPLDSRASWPNNRWTKLAFSVTLVATDRTEEHMYAVELRVRARINDEDERFDPLALLLAVRSALAQDGVEVAGVDHVGCTVKSPSDDVPF